MTAAGAHRDILHALDLVGDGRGANARAQRESATVFRPFLASKASKSPFISPVKTSSLAVASAPPYIGRSDLYCQSIAPVAVLTAENVPLGANTFRLVAMPPPLYWPTIGVPGL